MRHPTTGLPALNQDLLLHLAHFLSHNCLIALSSTCSTLRHYYRTLIFSSCHWDDDSPPPQSAWPLIRHLYIDDDRISSIGTSALFQNLDGLTSLHVRGDRLTDAAVHILASANNLTTLDFSYLCYRSNADWTPLPAFPALRCKPRMLQFCSRHDFPNAVRLMTYSINKALATRRAFATLLHQVDVSQIERLEVGMQSLSLPFAAAYTWTSLHTLVVTGISIHPADAAGEDERASDLRAHEHVHFGTLLTAAPRLRVLRIHCRSSPRATSPHYVAWPANELPPPSGNAISHLEELTIYNPAPDEGLLYQLPLSLRALSLVTYPHAHYDTLPMSFPILSETRALGGMRTADELLGILGRRPLPDLRQLRLSFRLHTSMALLKRIAALFPLLEVLEVHAECGPGCLWTPDELADLAHALAPLAHLRVLRLDTFNDVLDDAAPAAAAAPVIACMPEPEPDEDGEAFAAAQLRAIRYHPWMRGLPAAEIARALAPLSRVSEVWLPKMERSGLRSYRRAWQIYRIERQEGAARLCAEDGPTIEMVNGEY
ncbi:hypothetical protein HDZ31DRAFT_64217 [Schizophyllum fasciatum]